MNHLYWGLLGTLASTEATFSGRFVGASEGHVTLKEPLGLGWRP